jgi:hypothetical protein
VLLAWRLPAAAIVFSTLPYATVAVSGRSLSAVVLDRYQK